jgi:hypothetical protein
MIISCICLPCWHFREITEFIGSEKEEDMPEEYLNYGPHGTAELLSFSFGK